MPTRAITIDFWNTMVVAATGGVVRQKRRLERLCAAARTCRPDVTDADVQQTLRRALDKAYEDWRSRHVTPHMDSLVGDLWIALGVTVSDEEHDEVVRALENGLLGEGAPDFADGLREALSAAADRYPLAIISDTMISPGRVIRDLLAEREVLHHFNGFVFSDETGFSKPDARAFERAATALGVRPDELLHIGDLRRTDVAGIRDVGGTAVLYTGVQADDDDAPDPHAVLTHWGDLPTLLDDLTR